MAVRVFCLCVLFVSVQALQSELRGPNATEEILLVFTNRDDDSRIDLECRTDGGMLISDATFCARLPQQPELDGQCSPGNSGRFSFYVTPESEAVWTCRNSTGYSSLEELWIAACPAPRGRVGCEVFVSTAEPRVELECDYQRGRLSELYRVEWSRLQGEIPVSANKEENNAVNNETFSLTVDPVMTGARYFCEVSVVCMEETGVKRCSLPDMTSKRGNTLVLDGPQPITPSEVITATTLCLPSTINDTLLTSTQLPVFASKPRPTPTLGLPTSGNLATVRPSISSLNSGTAYWPVTVSVLILLIVATVVITVGCTFCVMKRRRSMRERVQLTAIKKSTSATSITAVGDGSVRVVMQHTSTTETNFTSPLDLHGDSGNYTQSTENTAEVQAITTSAVNPTAVALTPLSHGSVPIGFRDVESLPTPMAQRSIGKQPSLYSGQLSRSYVPSTHPSSVCTVSGQLEVIEYVQPASFIPFIGPLEVFLCSSYGGVYKTLHDVSIRIPKGAIPEGSTFRIEFGIALYGPFYYPGDSKAISPIIMLRVLPDNVQISKFLLPVKIKLPHYFDLCEDDIAQEKVGFMIASQEDEEERVSFRPGVSEHCSFIPKQQHGSIATEEFSESCYYCLTCREHSELSVSRGLYTLVKVVPQPIPAKAWDVHFCITYSMKPFIESVRRQYRGRGFKVSAQPQWRFKFSPPASEGREPAIGIALQQHQRQAGWQLTVEPNVQQIELLELDVWRNDPMQLCSQEEDRLYPPRFTIEVSGEAAVQSSEVLVSFTGIEERFAGKMRTKVSLPYIQQQGLGQAVVPCYAAAAPPHPTHSMHMNQAVVPYSLPQAGYPIAIQGRYHQQITYTETQRDPSEPSDEELTEAAKDITGILRSSWPMLLTYLKIPKHLAADIETDKSLLSAISRTLQVWRSLNTSANMREDLAGLLEKTDQRLHSVGRKLREGGGGGGVRRCLPPV